MGACWSKARPKEDLEEEPRLDAEQIQEAKIKIKWDGSIEFSPPVLPFTQTFEGVAGALEHSQSLANTKIEIVWRVYPENVNFRLMLQWMQIASKLHALPSLTSLKVDASWALLWNEGDDFGPQHAYTDMFFDSLPDKVTSLDINALRPATLLRKRTALLETIFIGNLNLPLTKHAYFADLFRLKSQRIKLDLGVEPDHILHELHDWGALDRNDHLQELTIQGTADADGGIPQALRRLRSINAHFNLKWRDEFDISLRKLSDLEQVEGLNVLTWAFATAMGNAGFRAQGDELELLIVDSKRWKRVSGDQVIEHFGWELKELDEDESKWIARACSFVHNNGVRIVMKLYK